MKLIIKIMLISWLFILLAMVSYFTIPSYEINNSLEPYFNLTQKQIFEDVAAAEKIAGDTQ